MFFSYAGQIPTNSNKNINHRAHRDHREVVCQQLRQVSGSFVLKKSLCGLCGLCGGLNFIANKIANGYILLHKFQWSNCQ